MAREMKDSGIAWIGDIPADWEVTKVLNGLEMPITDGPHTTPDLYDEGVAFVSAEAVSCGNGKIDFSHIRGYISEEFYRECCKKYIPAINDIYMIKSGATTGKVAIVDTIEPLFTIWSPLAVFRCNEKILFPKYLYYQLQSDSFQKQVELGWTFGTQQNIGMRSLEKQLITIPPVLEQHKIATFLDTECSRIDAVIELTRASIEEYKKLKQSVITQAVTKGIRPDRPMKDSGIEWIGDMPDKWVCTLLKRYCVFKTGSTPSTDNEKWFNGDLDWFTPADFNDKYYLSDSSRKLSQLAREDGVATMIPQNTVMIIGIGGTAGKIGYTTKECSCNQQITAIKADDEVYPKYLMYWMIANTTRLKDNALYTTLPIINNQTIGQYPFLVPDTLEEQVEIANYLDSKVIEIEILIEKKERFLAELELYKKSLIFEYVTGKKEVPA